MVMGLAGRERGLGGRYFGPEGDVILAVGVRPAHLDGGRWLAGRAGREKFLFCWTADSSPGCTYEKKKSKTSASAIVTTCCH